MQKTLNRDDIIRMTRWINRHFCNHEFFIDDLKPRDSSGFVSCECHKCGFNFKADHGFALPGKWVGWRKDVAIRARGQG